MFENFNPSYNSDFNLSLTQPFLRNFKTDARRTQIKVAKKNREISDVTFRQTVVNTVAGVKQSYYDLLYAIDNLEAQRKSLALATKFLEENQIKVRVGTMAPLDVVAGGVRAGEPRGGGDRGRGRGGGGGGRPEARDLQHQRPRDVGDAHRARGAADRGALPGRPRCGHRERPRQAHRHHRPRASGWRTRNTTSTYAKNQHLPNLDLIAAYGTTGIGGTQFLDRGDVTGEPLTSTIPGGFGDALSDLFGLDFPTWTLGFNFSYPIFNRQAGAAEAQARITRDQNLANIRRLEMQITGEVRSAARAVETNYKRVESTRAARVLQERRLDAETKKFAAGMSTNFLVTQSQRDLAIAEVAELRGDRRLPQEPGQLRARPGGRPRRRRRSRPSRRLQPVSRRTLFNRFRPRPRPNRVKAGAIGGSTA